MNYIKSIFSATCFLILLTLATSASAKTSLDSIIREQKYQVFFGNKPLGLKDQKDLTQFISSCDDSFSSKKEAAAYFSERAWEYVAEGKLDTATFRFNYVNALDKTNFDAFWGLGVISFQRKNFPLAIELLEKGLQLDSTQSTMRVDLAIVKLSCVLTNEACGTLDEAETLLARSLKEDPSNANAWMKRSQVAYLLGNYELAWTYYHECRQLDILQLDINFSQSLLEKMPDPKAIFKLSN